MKNELIAEAISLAGGTQDSLAKRAGVSQNAIYKLLQGKTKHPSYETACALEKAVQGAISRYDFIAMQKPNEHQTAA